MSAPNKDFDPVAVTPLSADSVDTAVKEALSAFAAATTLDELKNARLAHAGDKSPIALANREIGALPPAAKAEAGARIGKARSEISDALKAREAILLIEEENRMLAQEQVDVSLAAQTAPKGARQSWQDCHLRFSCNSCNKCNKAGACLLRVCNEKSQHIEQPEKDS